MRFNLSTMMEIKFFFLNFSPNVIVGIVCGDCIVAIFSNSSGNYVQKSKSSFSISPFLHENVIVVFHFVEIVS